MLPTSPTFLNLLLLSGDYQSADLNSLQIITFGSERMPLTLYRRLKNSFSHARLVQKYGVSELGSPRSQSKSEDASWIKLQSEHFQTKIIEGTLHVKTKTAMLGYLNAPSPFTEDGWFDTGDQIEQNGDYIRILGRKSDMINVGGEKVYPMEIEEVLQQMPRVQDVMVTGIPNPLIGQIVQANVQILTEETLSDFRQRMRDFCEEKIPRYKVPQKIVLTKNSLHGNRYKKIRKSTTL